MDGQDKPSSLPFCLKKQQYKDKIIIKWRCKKKQNDKTLFNVVTSHHHNKQPNNPAMLPTIHYHVFESEFSLIIWCTRTQGSPSDGRDHWYTTTHFTDTERQCSLWLYLLLHLHDIPKYNGRIWSDHQVFQAEQRFASKFSDKTAKKWVAYYDLVMIIMMQ